MKEPITEEHIRRWSDSVVQLRFPARTLAPYTSTWTTLIHHQNEALVIDPGFYERTSADALLAYLDVLRVEAVVGILITHAHRDHIDGLEHLEQHQASNVTVRGHQDALRAVPLGWACQPLDDRDVVAVGGMSVTALHTPGHAEGHLCFVMPDGGVVGGDLLTGSGPSFVGTPGGNATHYEESLRAVERLKPAWLAVSHGPAVRDPSAAIDAALAHRKRRETQLKVATQQPQSLSSLVEILYPDVKLEARAYLEQSTLAYLEKLIAEGAVVNTGSLKDGPYQSVQQA